MIARLEDPLDLTSAPPRGATGGPLPPPQDLDPSASLGGFGLLNHLHGVSPIRSGAPVMIQPPGLPAGRLASRRRELPRSPPARRATRTSWLRSAIPIILSRRGWSSANFFRQDPPAAFSRSMRSVGSAVSRRTISGPRPLSANALGSSWQSPPRHHHPENSGIVGAHMSSSRDSRPAISSGIRSGLRRQPRMTAPPGRNNAAASSGAGERQAIHLRREPPGPRAPPAGAQPLIGRNVGRIRRSRSGSPLHRSTQGLGQVSLQELIRPATPWCLACGAASPARLPCQWSRFGRKAWASATAIFPLPVPMSASGGRTHTLAQRLLDQKLGFRPWD